MDDQDKAKAQAQARYNAKQAKKPPVSIFHAHHKRKPQAFNFQPPAASTAFAPTLSPQPTPAAPVPAAPVPAMSANQPNGQGGQAGWGANLAPPGKPLGQTFPLGSEAQSEPTAEQGQAIPSEPSTFTAISGSAPEPQEANAGRRTVSYATQVRLQRQDLETKEADIKRYEHQINEQTETIKARDTELAQLQKQVKDLKRDNQHLEDEKKEASKGHDKNLQEQHSALNEELALEKGRYEQLEKKLAEADQAKDGDRITIERLNANLATLGARLSDRQALLDLYEDGTIRQKPNRAQWLEEEQQDIAALQEEVANLRAENADLSAACEQFEQAKLDAERSFNKVAARGARAANFGPMSTIQRMQKMHHQNDSSSNLSDDALTRHDSQTSQELDKIQLASGRLIDEIDSSDMESEGGSEIERDAAEEDEDGEKTQTDIKAQPQPTSRDTTAAQQQLSKDSKPDATPMDNTSDPVDPGRFEKMSEARKTQELCQYDRRLQEAIKKGKEKDGCIKRRNDEIEELKKAVQSRNAENSGLKERLKSQETLIQSQREEIKTAKSTLEDEGAKASETAEQAAKKDAENTLALRRQIFEASKTAREATTAKETAETSQKTMTKNLKNVEESLKNAREDVKKLRAQLQEKEAELENAPSKDKKADDLAELDQSPKTKDEKGQEQDQDQDQDQGDLVENESPKAQDEKEKDQSMPDTSIQVDRPIKRRNWNETWEQVGWPYLIPFFLALLMLYFVAESYQMRRLWLDANELTVQHVIDIQSGHSSIMPAPILAFFIWFENSFVEPSVLLG